MKKTIRFYTLLACGLVIMATAARADSAAVLAKRYHLSGSELSREEADALINLLESRIYLPAREYRRLQCEFTPIFIELNLEKNPALLRKAAYNMSFILFDGGNLFYLLQEANLFDARKAVFYWDRSAAADSTRLPATVRLFDAQGQPLAVQPFVGKILSYACLQMLNLDVANLLALPSPNPDMELHTYLDARQDDDQVLNCLFKLKSLGYWQTFEIHCDKTRKPLSAGIKQWNEAAGQWQWASSPYFFQPLGQTGKVAVARMGRAPLETRLMWKKEGPDWMVERASGQRENFESEDKSQGVPWSYAFSGFQVNTSFADDPLQLPAGKKIRLDFSSPEATVGTIFNCLLQDRLDLLPYCTTHPPQKPVPEHASPSYLGYLFATNRGIHERLKVLDKMQYGDEWLFHIQVPKLWMKQDLETTYKLIDVDGQWKMDGSFEGLENGLNEQ